MKPVQIFHCLIGSFWVSLATHSLDAAVFNIADGDVVALKAALTTAATNHESDAINLAPNGTYTLTSIDNTTNGDNGLPVIGHDQFAFGIELTIHGNGATIQRDFANGTPSFRIFEIIGGNISLDHLVIENGDGGFNGGGVANSGSGTVALINCTFSSNFAGGGGGVSNIGTGTINLTNCLLDNDQGAERGGGILNQSTGTINIRGTTFTFNTATYWGGVIYNQANGTVTIAFSTLEQNGVSNKDGGAIFNQSGTITINQTGLSLNTARGGGGAIYSNGGQVTLTDSTLSGNNAAQGGAVGVFGGVLTVTRCNFISNSTRGAGAAIFNAATATVDHSDFAHNEITTSVESVSTDPAGSSCNGAALSNSGSSATISLTACRIDTSLATILGAGSAYGIAIYNDGGTVDLTDSRIDDGMAVFGHDLEGNYGTIVFEGGAVFNNSTGAVNLARCTVSDNLLPIGNTASTTGGGIFNNGSGSIAILNSTVAFNTATFGGGVWNNASGTIDLSYSTVGFNSAGSAGGIGNVNGPFNVKSTIVAVNSVIVTARDVSGNFTSAGFNLIGVDQNNGFNAATDKRGGEGAPLDPQFNGNSLADNGGPTLTMALLAGSPAINSGDNNAPPLDQRGYLRVGVPDIGAFEFGGKPLRITSIARLANAHVVLHCVGIPNDVNDLQISPDLSAGGFAPISPAPAAADASGAFQYDDPGAVSLTRRYYRLAFP
jgi:hypothetical protein